MKRPLFVFAGQSNMMGAAVYCASEQIYYKDSYEYLHKSRRFGADMGQFKGVGFPVGEFSYKDLGAAYGENADANSKSTLADYDNNSYFCPAFDNFEDEETKKLRSFSIFSESDMTMQTALPPYMVKGLEENGIFCAYAHIAKGGKPISYYLEGEAKEYFYEKTRDFFADCEKRFAGDDMSEKIFVWLQGESNRLDGYEYYLGALEQLWCELKAAGFTKFFMIRVPYWSSDSIVDIMRAQEDFCKNTEGAYMLTRACSFIPWYSQNTDEWFDGPLGEEYENCRDAFYGFGNHHINDKGFKLVARHAVPNIVRILKENKQPILEEERILLLK